MLFSTGGLTLEQEEDSRQSSMAVRLKLSLSSQQALPDLPLPKCTLHVSQSSCSSKSNREDWGLSCGRGYFFSSGRTADSALVLKAIFHFSKEAMPWNIMAELFSPPETHLQRDAEGVEEATAATHGRNIWGHGTLPSLAAVVPAQVC